MIMFEFSSCLFADSAMNLVSDSSNVYEEFPLLRCSFSGNDTFRVKDLSGGNIEPIIKQDYFLHIISSSKCSLMSENKSSSGELDSTILGVSKSLLFERNALLEFSKGLRRLYLDAYKFSGVIPANLSSCSNLEDLHLGQNKLLVVGSIPKEMSLLSKLSLLVIQQNKLTGGIPPYFGNTTSMEVFAAAKNPFGGCIPDTLGLLKSLREFD
ncbi:leucine-rich repeat protein [Tanacetum coccineum]